MDVTTATRPRRNSLSEGEVDSENISKPESAAMASEARP
jgi:hypothetical protein